MKSLWLTGKDGYNFQANVDVCVFIPKKVRRVDQICQPGGHGIHCIPSVRIYVTDPPHPRKKSVLLLSKSYPFPVKQIEIYEIYIF